MAIKHLLCLALSTLIPNLAMADECAITVGANDAMQFDTKAITVSNACKKFTVTLTHTGKLTKQVMGHNWVLSTPEDVQAITTAGISAGADAHYLKMGDARVIAFTKIIGAGESTSVNLPLDQLIKGKNYTFFCSFPGHIALMKGTLTRE